MWGFTESYYQILRRYHAIPFRYTFSASLVGFFTTVNWNRLSCSYKRAIEQNVYRNHLNLNRKMLMIAPYFIHSINCLCHWFYVSIMMMMIIIFTITRMSFTAFVDIVHERIFSLQRLNRFIMYFEMRFL